MQNFETWFTQVTVRPGTNGIQPHRWQSELAESALCENRLIRIPTGMGKTLGVLLAWTYHRVVRRDSAWPNRLVWCLPMRTLVEQTANEAKKVLESSGLADSVEVHRVMGGVDEADWFASPETPMILIGTQDMLLSRALNRGYAMGRAAWPRAFGAINCDALWVMDEVQLMGVGLTTSAQIQAFWESSKELTFSLPAVPRATWWMSATLQPQWLASQETESTLPALKANQLCVVKQDWKGPLWDAQKPLSIASSDVDEWAKIILDAHQQHQPDSNTGRQTLVVVNTVKRAKELYNEIEKLLKSIIDKPQIRLIHSRFRPHERRKWADEFLSRETLHPNVDRILIATQVVEAGVDISASCLITELAPWPSLVQRFGRAARYGGQAKVIVLDCKPDDKKALPYAIHELESARSALTQLRSVSIRDLEEFEIRTNATDPSSLKKLYPFQPLHVLMQHEFEELFDTSPDLSGADMDVSRFIRNGNEERDVQIFWRTWTGKKPPNEFQPLREELCSVSIVDARPWIKKLEVDRGQVWHWDYIEGLWLETRADSLRPGLVLMIAADAGGYDPLFGFTGIKHGKGQTSLDLTTELKQPDVATADLSEDSEIASEADWKTIVTHCREAGETACSLAESLGLNSQIKKLIVLALRLHDWGKGHPSFSTGTYRVEPVRKDLAKACKGAWRSLQKFYETKTHGPRPGFRHELVSSLATLELLRLLKNDHVAFQGNDGELIRLLYSPLEGHSDSIKPSLAANPISMELAELSYHEFNVLLFLIACHHGKVRMSLQASPKDQDFPFEDSHLKGTGMPIRGVRQGDVLPAIRLPDAEGNAIEMPEIELDLSSASIGLSERYGPSWSERMLELVSTMGPFSLGYLENLVRTADSRASALSVPDKILAGIVFKVPSAVSPVDVSLADEIEAEDPVNQDLEWEDNLV